MRNKLLIIFSLCFAFEAQARVFTGRAHAANSLGYYEPCNEGEGLANYLLDLAYEDAIDQCEEAFYRRCLFLRDSTWEYVKPVATNLFVRICNAEVKVEGIK